MVKSGRCSENEDILLNASQYLKTAKEIMKLKKKYKKEIKISFHRFNILDKNSGSCPRGEKLFHVNASGKLTPCPWIAKFDKKFITENSLKDTSFSKLIRSKCIKEFKKMIINRDKKFGPGCPAICFSENNSFMSKDPLYRDGGKFVSQK
jgi:MoaA/NifB/PqqE/SkfB family radical SAM enzyme